jgi:lysozyme
VSRICRARQATAEVACLLSALGCLLLSASGCGPAAERESESVAATSEAVTVCAQGNVIEGVDVSHWDGTIDWGQVHSAGIAFAIAKATEADGYVDPTFDTNRQNAEAAGVAFGAYHFFRANVDPTTQANHFLDTIGSVEPGEISPTLDLETTDGEGGSTIAQRAVTFMQVVQAQTGRVPMVYTSPSFFNSTIGAPDSFAPFLLWIANWQVSCPDVPSVWSDWTAWQYTDSGSVSGISTAVDRDQFDGTVDELQCAGVTCATGTCVAGRCVGGGGGAGGADTGGAGGTAGADTGGAGGAGAGGGQGATGVGAAFGQWVNGIPGENSGCSCHAIPAVTPRGPWLLAWLAALAPLVRRRRNAPRRRMTTTAW